MLNTIPTTRPIISGQYNPPLGIRATFGGAEPRKNGTAFGNVLRCWNCGTQIGERVGMTLYVSSNKVELGGIPLVATVWRRCRGGKSNPACRAINLLPQDWVKLVTSPETTASDKQPTSAQTSETLTKNQPH